MKRLFLSAALFCLCILPHVHAVDFGAVISGQFKAENSGEDTLSGRTILAPWLTLPLGTVDFFFSAGVNADFTKKAVIFAPEILRLEFFWRPAALLTFRAGRINWQDPSHFTVKGRFDGTDFIFDLGKIRLGVAALYTGFLYKETADINKSPTDPKDYSADFDWKDFGNTYFAPRRMLASLHGEFPGFPAGRGHLYAGLMAQFDLSNAYEHFHTQYLLLRHTIIYKQFDLAASGAVELENTEAEGVKAAFAVSLEGGWLLPSSIKDRLSLGLRWASGNGPQTASYFPVVREAQGLVLKPSLSGMMIIRVNYEARFLPSLSAELGGRYFIRTDSTSYVDPVVTLNNKSYFLGAEFDAAIRWVPFSDISFSLTGGIFLPKTGGAMPGDALPRLLLSLGTIFSF